MDTERILPKAQRFETWFRDNEYELMVELEAIREDQDNNDILFQGIVESQSIAANNLRATAQFLTEVVFDADDRACQTVHRSLVFSHQIATFILEEFGYRLEDYVQSLYEAEDAQHLLDTEVRGEYLAENPSVRNILRHYAKDIDQYRGYEHLVESSGGMVFMLVERSLGKKWMLEDTESYTLFDEFDSV